MPRAMWDRRAFFSVSVSRLERERHAQRAGDLDLQQDLQRTTLFARLLDGPLSSADRLFERAVDRPHRIDGLLELDVHSASGWGLQLQKIVVHAHSIPA